MSVEEQASLAIAGVPDVSAAGAACGAAQADLPCRRALIAFGYYFAVLAIAISWVDAIVPDRIAVTFFGRAATFVNIHDHILKAGLLGFVITPLAFLVELLIVGWPDSSLRHLLFARSPSSRSDLVSFVLWQSHAMNFVRVVLTFGTALISGYAIHSWILTHTGFDLGLNRAPGAVAFIGYLLVFTFCDYWTHRLDHSRCFWPTHRYHHSADDFFIVTSNRGNPGAFTGIVANALPLGILGMPAATGFWIYALVATQHLIIHSRINSDFGWFGRYILQSPAHHRLHHTIDTTRPTAHFSLLPLWDHLFGTWQAQRRHGATPRIRIGVAEPYRHGVWILPDIWRDYREFLAGLVGRR